MHPVLLGLPALINARCQLLTVEGRDMMPGTNSAMLLDLTKMDRRRERAAHGLNTLAYKLIDEGPVQTAQLTWENLGFQEFGPQPICAFTEQIKPVADLDVPVEQSPQGDTLVHESTSDLTDSSEVFQSGSAHSVSEPIQIPITHAFDSPMQSDESEEDESPGILPCCPLLLPENVRWRPEFTSEQLHHIKETERCAFEWNFDFCT